MSVSVVSYGASFAGEGDSVTGTVTLRSENDLLKVPGQFSAFFIHRIENVQQYSDHGQSVTSS